MKFSATPFLYNIAFILLILLFQSKVNAQLNADFTPDKNGGCSPLAVTFTNSTTGASANAKWQWDFSNGNTSSLKNPAAIFSTETTYNITLTVTDGAQTSTKTKTITVYKKPVIDFSVVPANGCTPLNTMLTGSMTGGDGTISTWNWDFGDGSVEQTNSPVVNHLYNFKQTASVSLTATNNYGCAGTILKNNIVTVKDSVKASFTVNQRTFCEYSANASFTNTSTGAGLLTYLWDFGDGGSSIAASPTHTFTTRGIYTVKLTVSSSEGCTVSKVETDYINVGSFVSDFVIPTINCENRPILFKNTSSPDPSQSNWFVNGLPITATSDTALEYYFPSAGLYTVRLVNDFDICQQEVTKQVEIRRNPKIDSFIIDHGVFCSKPYRVNFRDTSSEAVAWRWSFSAWDRVDATTQNTSYDYGYDASYWVRLEIDNAEGCTSSIIQYVNVISHSIYIPIHPYDDQACDSLTKVVQAISNYPITNYLWDFQDGSTSTEATPTHTFKGRGEKWVTLTYTTEGGCTGTIQGQVGLVLEPPKADFKIDSVICGDNWLPLNINWISGDAYWYKFDMGIGKGYDWLFSDFRYTEEGVYTISMITGNGFCADTVTKQNVVRVKGPWVRIQDVIYTCDGDRNTIIFKDSTTACDKWTWDFGDGATQTYNTYQPTLTHTYANSTNYEVKLKGERDGCTIEKTAYVYILKKQNPVLTLDQPVCINEPAPFHIRGLEDNVYILSDFSPRYYFKKWEYHDGTPFNGSWNNTNPWSWYLDLDGDLVVDQIKEDSIRMIMTSHFHNCEDTTNYVPIVVKGVNTNFEVVSDSTCFKSLVILRDNSTAIGSNTITSWRWDFGDGQQLTTTIGGLVNHRYDGPGQYIVTLSASDAGGCTNSITNATRPVTVLGVKASFSVSPSTTVAPYNPLQFNNTSNTTFAGTVTWQWDFGDGNSSSAVNPVHAYASQGTYTARLIAIDNFSNCRDTAMMVITCGPEVTNFTINTAFIGDQSACPPVKAAFAYTSNLPTDSIVWNFGDGFILEDQTHPSHIFTMAGQYIVTLHVYFQSVLMGTHSDTVNVSSPPAAIAADDLSLCIGESLILHSPLKNDGYNYTWDFGNGYVVNGSDTIATNSYNMAGTFSPSLIVRNAGGCATSIKLTDNILVHPDPIISVAPAAALACKDNGVQLQANGGQNYVWSPATGLNSNSISNPVATPAVTTNYSIQATDINGCKGSANITVTVPQPFSMQAITAADICKGKKAQLNASGAVSYKWINNVAGLTNTNIPNPVANPMETTVYTVVGFDQYQCYHDTAKVTVTVRPSPTVTLGNDLQVIVGTSQTLQSTSSSDVVRWQWSPADYLSCSNCPAPVSTPYNSIEYLLKVFNQYNCEATDSIKLTAFCTDGNINIPNAFTPNHDGHNDVFGIPGQGISKISFLKIYNRWGEIVFEKKDIVPGDITGSWNGKYKGLDAPAGVYVYMTELECSASVRFRQQGTVMLIR